MKRLAIETPWPDAPVYYKKSTASTMEDARRLFEGGCPDGTAILTDYQTRGRGRMADRSWFAEEGKNLLFTVVLRDRGGSRSFGEGPQRLPLLAGLALALSVEQLYGETVRLKWPNDLLVGEKKLAGVLCEALAEGDSLGVLIGIGVNCNQLSFPPELTPRATSLALVLGRQVVPSDLATTVLRMLKVCLDDGDWHPKVTERLYGLGREAVVLAATEPSGQTRVVHRGTVLGLNRDGALLLRSERGAPESVYGGELHFAAEGPALKRML